MAETEKPRWTAFALALTVLVFGAAALALGDRGGGSSPRVGPPGRGSGRRGPGGARAQPSRDLGLARLAATRFARAYLGYERGAIGAAGERVISRYSTSRLGDQLLAAPVHLPLRGQAAAPAGRGDRRHGGRAAGRGAGARDRRPHSRRGRIAPAAGEPARTRGALARRGDRTVSERGSALRRHLQRRAVRKLVAKVGVAKLALAAAAALAAFLLFLILLAVLAGASASEGSEGRMSCRASGGAEAPPARLVPIYAAAAARFALGARGPGMLAAINKVESDFGRSEEEGVHSGANYAGAQGPMQFLQGTWETYGLDGDGDGAANVYDPADAIFGAANLLHTEGAPGDWYGAIFSYNHADWYVREVAAPGEAVQRADRLYPGRGAERRRERGAAAGADAPQPAAVPADPQPPCGRAGARRSRSTRGSGPTLSGCSRPFTSEPSPRARAGHNTHGDGTAIDMVPEGGKGLG